MNGPSPHLSWDELACKDGTPYPEGWRKTRAVVLAAEFEKVRALVGSAIRIGSGYRTQAHNKRVGGAKFSQHMEGRALDLYPPAGMNANMLARLVRSIANEDDSAIVGLGYYDRFVHIDVRPPTPKGGLVVWSGARTWADGSDV